jgi:CBS domain-containing protein
MPEKPIQELWVALAGPAVNVAIAVVLFPVVVLISGLEPLSNLSLTAGPLMERLLVANLFLVGFNMLPAFPMDGGRVLRALLAMRLPYARATKIAGSIGQGMALLFGLAGLFGNPFLLFIALFVWIGATQETAAAQMKAVTSGVPVRDAMITDFRTLAPADPLSRAIEQILRGSQQDFPVADNGKITGILTRSDLLSALARHGQELPVSQVMQRSFSTTEENEMLESALTKLQACDCHTLPVTRRGTLVGMITMENLGELLLIRSALDAAAGRGKPNLYPVDQVLPLRKEGSL